MKTVAIMQPTYLSWLGYFALMDRVDIFVFLDSVQFARRSWQQRNCIKTANGAQRLTVPVISKSLRGQLISEVQIDQTSRFVKKHIKAIELAYKKTPFFGEYSEKLFSILRLNHENLCDLNIALIKKIKGFLGIEAEFLKSSSLNVKKSKADLLADICDKLSTNTYISPPGSRNYMEQSTAFGDRGITVLYNDYRHPEYAQLNGPFEPYMSVIDLIFNEGPRSRDIIRKGIVSEKR